MAALAHDDGDLVDPDLEAIKQRLHAWLGLDVLIGERLPVPGEELLDSQRVRGVARADQDQVGAALGDERDPPQDERAHHQLAQLGVSLYERAQVLAVDDHDRAARATRARTRLSRPESMLISPVNPPGAELDDPLLVAVDDADDLDPALDDDEQAGVPIARLEEDLACARGPALADAGHPRELSGGQLREHLFAAVLVRVGHHPCSGGLDLKMGIIQKRERNGRGAGSLAKWGPP